MAKKCRMSLMDVSMDYFFTLVVIFHYCDQVWPPKFVRIPPGLVIVAGRREIESIRTTNNIWQSAGLQTRKKSLVMTTWIKKMKKGDEKTEKALSSLYNGISGVCTPYIRSRDIQSSDSPENLRPISCRYVECLSWQGPHNGVKIVPKS